MCCEIFNLKAYNNMLEFKATETVFFMSHVWQEIQFERIKSLANIDEASEKLRKSFMAFQCPDLIQRFFHIDFVLDFS